MSRADSIKRTMDLLAELKVERGLYAEILGRILAAEKKEARVLLSVCGCAYCQHLRGEDRQRRAAWYRRLWRWLTRRVR